MTISFPIFNAILPAGKLVFDVNVNDVSEAVIAPFNVVLIPDETPVILTLLEVEYMP